MWVGVFLWANTCPSLVRLGWHFPLAEYWNRAQYAIHDHLRRPCLRPFPVNATTEGQCQWNDPFIVLHSCSDNGKCILIFRIFLEFANLCESFHHNGRTIVVWFFLIFFWIFNALFYIVFFSKFTHNVSLFMGIFVKRFANFSPRMSLFSRFFCSLRFLLPFLLDEVEFSWILLLSCRHYSIHFRTWTAVSLQRCPNSTWCRCQ